MLDESSHTSNRTSANKLTKKQKDQLKNIRHRKLELMKEVTERDRRQLLEITKTMEEEKFEVINEFPSSLMTQMTNMFKEMTNEDLEAVLKKNKVET